MADVTLKITPKQASALRRFVDANRPGKIRLRLGGQAVEDWLLVEDLLDSLDAAKPVDEMRDGPIARAPTVRMRRITPDWEKAR